MRGGQIVAVRNQSRVGDRFVAAALVHVRVVVALEAVACLELLLRGEIKRRTEQVLVQVGARIRHTAVGRGLVLVRLDVTHDIQLAAEVSIAATVTTTCHISDVSIDLMRHDQTGGVVGRWLTGRSDTNEAERVANGGLNGRVVRDELDGQERVGLLELGDQLIVDQDEVVELSEQVEFSLQIELLQVDFVGILAVEEVVVLVELGLHLSLLHLELILNLNLLVDVLIVVECGELNNGVELLDQVLFTL